MADLLSFYTHNSVGRQVFEQMPNPSDEQWPYHGYDQAQPFGQWPAQDQTSATLAEITPRTLQHQHQQQYQRQHQQQYQQQHQSTVEYAPSYHWEHNQMIVRGLGFDQATWASDIDMEPTSSAGFHGEFGDSFTHQHSSNHLHPVTGHTISSTLHSPQTSHGGYSPQQAHPLLPSSGATPKRPVFNRSTTAPARQPGLSADVPTALTPTGDSMSGDDDDAASVPASGIGSEESGGKARIRKRQRMPHTAVERRYRENLNLHLDKLRLAVPVFAARRPSGTDASGSSDQGTFEAAKPSKVEVLNGAIEHISQLTQRNGDLEDEVKALQAQIEDLERRTTRAR